jgi:hypothetical protein
MAAVKLLNASATVILRAIPGRVNPSSFWAGDFPKTGWPVVRRPPSAIFCHNKNFGEGEEYR